MRSRVSVFSNCRISSDGVAHSGDVSPLWYMVAAWIDSSDPAHAIFSFFTHQGISMRKKRRFKRCSRACAGRSLSLYLKSNVPDVFLGSPSFVSNCELRVGHLVRTPCPHVLLLVRALLLRPSYANPEIHPAYLFVAAAAAPQAASKTSGCFGEPTTRSTYSLELADERLCSWSGKI